MVTSDLIVFFFTITLKQSTAFDFTFTLLTKFVKMVQISISMYQ